MPLVFPFSGGKFAKWKAAEAKARIRAPSSLETTLVRQKMLPVSDELTLASQTKKTYFVGLVKYHCFAVEIYILTGRGTLNAAYSTVVLRSRAAI